MSGSAVFFLYQGKKRDSCTWVITGQVRTAMLKACLVFTWALTQVISGLLSELLMGLALSELFFRPMMHEIGKFCRCSGWPCCIQQSPPPHSLRQEFEWNTTHLHDKLKRGLCYWGGGIEFHCKISLLIKLCKIYSLYLMLHAWGVLRYKGSLCNWHKPHCLSSLSFYFFCLLSF